MDLELTKAIETMSAKMGEVDTRFGAFDAKLAELEGKLPKPADPVAKMEQGGALEGITKLEVWDIPIGKAIVGGFSAVVVSELIDGFLAAQSTMTQGLVKLAAAGASVKWLSRFLGATGAGAMALLLAYDGIRSMLPIDEWAGRFSGAISKIRTGGGLAGKAGMKRYNVIEQAEKVAGNYYSGVV